MVAEGGTGFVPGGFQKLNVGAASCPIFAQPLSFLSVICTGASTK